MIDCCKLMQEECIHHFDGREPLPRILNQTITHSSHCPCTVKNYFLVLSRAEARMSWTRVFPDSVGALCVGAPETHERRDPENFPYQFLRASRDVSTSYKGASSRLRRIISVLVPRTHRGYKVGTGRGTNAHHNRHNGWACHHVFCIPKTPVQHVPILFA